MIDTTICCYSPEEALEALNWIMDYNKNSASGQNTQYDYRLHNACVEALQEQINHKKVHIGLAEKRQPIRAFNTDEELQASLAEWQERLFLNHWNIKAYLVHGDEIKDLSGDSTVQWVNSCGTIRIRYANEMPDGMIEKEPHEKTLVHELLHFKYMGFAGDSIESVFFDEKQHQLLEQMAKSLIMAKYGISYGWFKN